MRQIGFLVGVILIIWGLTACNAVTVVDSRSAQQQLQQVWQANQHGVWQIEWARLPVGGAVVVEIWQVGKRYRWEILEAPTVDLVGQTLVFNGHEAWRYQRLTPLPLHLEPTRPQLTPITEVWAKINSYLEKPSIAATQQFSHSLGHHYETLTLTFADNTELNMTIDKATHLPHHLQLVQEGQVITLKVRQMEPLEQPIEGLFTPCCD